jgi:hypothetical protein
VDDVVGEQREHRLAVAAVERGVVGEHQLDRAVLAAGAVDLHRGIPVLRGRP